VIPLAKRTCGNCGGLYECRQADGELNKNSQSWCLLWHTKTKTKGGGGNGKSKNN